MNTPHRPREPKGTPRGGRFTVREPHLKAMQIRVIPKPRQPRKH